MFSAFSIEPGWRCVFFMVCLTYGRHRSMEIGHRSSIALSHSQLVPKQRSGAVTHGLRVLALGVELEKIGGYVRNVSNNIFTRVGAPGIEGGGRLHSTPDRTDTR